MTLSRDKLKKTFLFFIWIILSLLVFPSFVFGKVDFSLELPQEQLVRGQVFDWKVNITVEDETVTKEEFYFTYDANLLERQEFLAGDFFENVSYTEVEKGKLYVVGESNTPKSGSGLVAVARMKIIASEPGSAQLCAVLRITPSPTQSPTSPSATPVPTSPPPRPGNFRNFLNYAFLGTLFLALATVVRLI